MSNKHWTPITADEVVAGDTIKFTSESNDVYFVDSITESKDAPGSIVFYLIGDYRHATMVAHHTNTVHKFND